MDDIIVYLYELSLTLCCTINNVVFKLSSHLFTVVVQGIQLL
jgi:hypothetical protein